MGQTGNQNFPAQSQPATPNPILNSQSAPLNSYIPQQQSANNGAVTQSADPSYVLQPKDYIQITVYQEDNLTTVTRISAAGQITFPLIGQIQLGGLTVAQANQKIRSMLMDGYIRDPKVSLTVTYFATRTFTVLGQVQKPGAYEMPQQESVTLLQAIGLAGGFTNLAQPGNITVKRLEKGKEVLYKLDAKKMQTSDAKQFYIAPDDTITVAESLF